MVIFVDMDEVVADTYLEHILWYNKEFDEDLNIESCGGHEVWQMVPADRQKSIRKHCYTKGFFRNLQPIEDSISVLEKLNEKHQVYIASAAMQFPNSLEEKSEWLDEFLPFIPWSNRILCGYKHILRGDLLIDDRTFNLKTFQGDTILFTSPHNINETGFTRANSWKEIGQKLL